MSGHRRFASIVEPAPSVIESPRMTIASPRLDAFKVTQQALTDGIRAGLDFSRDNRSRFFAYSPTPGPRSPKRMRARCAHRGRRRAADGSYLIDLERETANAEIGPARRFLSSLRAPARRLGGQCGRTPGRRDQRSRCPR